jgi:arylesterase / paraoxonase
MNKELRTAFGREMDAARVGYAGGNLDLAFRHLERAHILGQRALWPHIVTHWWMLKIGIRRSDAREIRGQITRMIAAVFGYVFGWVPLGNTGGANVSPIRPMPVPPEFAMFFDGYDARRHQRQRLMMIMMIGIIVGIGAFGRGVWARAGEGTDVITDINGDCRPIEGAQGAEDIVIDVERRVAYGVGGDRRPFRDGGPGRAKIWSIPLGADGAGDAADVANIAPAMPPTLRSFGADLHIDAGGTRRLFVANRPNGGHTIEIFRVTPAGGLEHERTLGSPLLRNPNDVQAIGPGTALVTLDKEASAGTTMEIVEGALERSTGKVLRIGADGAARVVADGIKMANGIALSGDGRTLYVAEMIGRGLLIFDRDPQTNQLTLRGRIPLAAAPDNLTVAPDGRVFIAAHPKLLTLALGYQKSEDRPSPSMVFAYDPASNTVRKVMSSDGREIAASSVAALDPRSRALLVGSAFGPHVLRCALRGV